MKLFRSIHLLFIQSSIDAAVNQNCKAVKEKEECEKGCNDIHHKCVSNCKDGKCHSECARQHEYCYADCPCHDNCWHGCPCETYDGCAPSSTDTPSTTTQSPIDDDGFALSSEDLAKFRCRRDDSWQLPEYCGTNCRESDKTFLKEWV